MTSKVQATKVKIDMEDYIKLKSFYTAKEIINRVKRHLQNGRKYLQTVHLLRSQYPKYKLMASPHN